MALIVLLTDFGNKDYFVGTMKGVIAGINPIARVIDLTHEIRPQNIQEASFQLWASYRFFPEDTVFVAVVDPGVGTGRKIIAARLDNRFYLVPDNGLLDYVVAESENREFYLVENNRYFLSDVSSTFHGRDIFAPVAAYISKGLRLNELGSLFSYRHVKKFYSSIAPGINESNVVYIDHFGNVFTGFLWDDELLTKRVKLTLGRHFVTVFASTYGDLPEKKLGGVHGSCGLLEIAARNGNASSLLRAKMGMKIKLTVKE
ncbi:MAG: SAM hydrolase/SAM-dependent halogenase family protein [Candidatus Kryptoniota bacterium]